MSKDTSDRRQFVRRAVKAVAGLSLAPVTAFDADAHQGLHRVAIRVKGWD